MISPQDCALRSKALTIVVPLLLAFLLQCTSFAAQEWKSVFDPYKVLTLHLQMAPSDWDRIRFDQPIQDETWIPEVAEALFWAEGEAPIRVAVRRKGQSDTPLPEGDPQKVSLKIDLNELVSGQKWRGLNKLSLENGSDTPLKEGFAWLLHRLAWEGGLYGYEAANSGWVRLNINGELKGVFVNAEQRDAQFLRNHGYDKPGATWLYKVDGSSALEVGTGHSPAYQHLCYSPFSQGPGGGQNNGCTQPDLEIDLPQWVDVRGLFTLAAVNAFTENKDDLFSHSGKNSYAVDFNPPYPRTRLYFPWDLDTTIQQGNMGIYGSEAYQAELLLHPWFQRVYEQILRDLINGPFSPAALHAAVDRLGVNVGPALDEDPFVYPSGSAGPLAELHAWVDTRVASVSGQLTQPWIHRPQFNQAGGEVVAGFLLAMSAPTGAVYYTLDGSDPRAPGGGFAPSAIRYMTPIPIHHSLQVIARALDGATWSPLPATANFSIARYASALRITELMYHPRAEALAEDDYEFLELKNTGAQTLDLSGFSFEGIDFLFAAGTKIPAGEFFVLARNATAFSSRYSEVAVNGVYWGKLSDAGERIRLLDPQGNTVISIEYEDEPPWPLSADGLGYSLVLQEPAGDPDAPQSWRGSSRQNGSPGADDPVPPFGLGVLINEVLAHTDPPLEDAIELFNSGPVAVDLSGWYLSDDFVETNGAASFQLKKFRIPAGTMIAAGGYKVFYERDFRTSNPLVPFGLSELGETVYLSSANSSGDLTGYVTGARFGPSENGVSMGRYAASTEVQFVPLAEITFGPAGTGAPNAGPRVGPVVINEIMYNPTGAGSEFIELLNLTGGPINLGGWKIAGADFIFPSGSSIPANGLVLLLKTNITSVSAFRAAHQLPSSVPIHGHDFVLENEGEALRLEKPNASPLDPPLEIERVRYNDKTPWPTEADGEGPSLERFSGDQFGNDPINWRTVRIGGSPGRRNEFPLGLAVTKSSAWKYYDGGGDLGTAWRAPEYSDSGWAAGDGTLGYGSVGLGTLLSFGADPEEKPVTVYFRKEFVVYDPIATVRNLRLEAVYDDGFVLYLNGTEILRSPSMPEGTLSFSTPATAYNSIGYESFDLSAWSNLLKPGENVLAVEVHQESASSDDLLWDAALTYDVSTQPVVELPVITPSGGIYAGPVQVSITASPADATVYFTLNGTDPDQNSALYTQPFTLQANAEVQARAYKPGYNESTVAAALFRIGVAGHLEILSSEALSSSGAAGGPFTPTSITSTLTNTGGMSLNWDGRRAANWISLSATHGTLGPGDSTSITISINAEANLLVPGSYQDNVVFLDVTSSTNEIAMPVYLNVEPRPTLLRVSTPTANQLGLTLEGEPFQSYVIEASTDLTQWNPVYTNVVPVDGIAYVDTLPIGAGQRFYRARITR